MELDSVEYCIGKYGLFTSEKMLFGSKKTILRVWNRIKENNISRVFSIFFIISEIIFFNLLSKYLRASY